MGQEEEKAEEEGIISKEIVVEVEKIIGLAFTDTERQLMLKKLDERLGNYEKLRAIKLDNSVPPALYFDPRPSANAYKRAVGKGTKKKPFKMSEIPIPPVPDDLEDLLEQIRKPHLGTRYYVPMRE